MAQDLFLKIPEIPGESQKRKGEIDIDSFSFGVNQTGTFATGGKGGGAGKASFHDISATKAVDKASPKLFQACAKGTHFDSMTITSQKAGDKPMVYYTLELGSVLVSGLHNSGAGDADQLHESFTLNFATAKFTYTEQQADGSAGPKTMAGHDVRQNIAIG